MLHIFTGDTIYQDSVWGRGLLVVLLMMKYAQRTSIPPYGTGCQKRKAERVEDFPHCGTALREKHLLLLKRTDAYQYRDIKRSSLCIS